MKLEDLLKKSFDSQQNKKADLARIAKIKKGILVSLPLRKGITSDRRFSSQVFIYAVGAFAVVLLTLWGIFNIKGGDRIAKNPLPKPTIQPNPSKEPELTNKPTKRPVKDPDIKLASGFGFNLPKNWSAKIANQSKNHFSGRFFIPGKNTTSTYIEIESISGGSLSKSSLVKVESTKKQVINGLQAEITEGQENFQNSNRQVKQVLFTSNNHLLLASLYQNPGDEVTNEFDAFIRSVQDDKVTSRYPFFIQNVYAAESIAGIDIEKYKRVEVMADPLTELITKNDPTYAGGYAKFYKFDAFKGQRLTTVALEDNTDSSTYKSYIKSELYDESGQQLYSLDTRIEYEAQYTGTYYLVVRTFDNQEGTVRLKIFDRNQTENLTYLKFADGSEELVDYSKKPQYGSREIALIMQFISPVEITENQAARFLAKPQEFEADPGEVTVPIRLYSKPGSYQEDILQKTSLPEDNQSNLQKIRITKLSPSKILIEPEQGGLFPKNHHFHLMLYVPVGTGAMSYGGHRFFTEDQ